MADRVKFYDVADIRLGHVVKDRDGKDWVFCGFGTTNESREAFFVRSVEGRSFAFYGFSYKAVYVDTLTAKFPSLPLRDSS